jgi:hypothetical protein
MKSEKLQTIEKLNNDLTITLSVIGDLEKEIEAITEQLNNNLLKEIAKELKDDLKHSEALLVEAWLKYNDDVIELCSTLIKY